MKKSYFLTFLLSYLGFISYSQKFICGESDVEILNKFNSTNLQLLIPVDDPNIKHVFNIMYHVVYNDDGITRTNTLGVPGLIIGENEVLQSVQNLNIAFNRFNIFFKYYGMDQVNETDFLTIETSAELNQLRNSQFSNPDSMNIYIINGGVIGAAARVAFFDDDYFVDPWTQCHEMGHYFGLAHPDTSNICEHSTRNSNNPNFNADVAGDGVVDTHISINNYFNNNCIYNGGATDCLGALVVAEPMSNGEIVYPSFQNFMYATYNFDGLTCVLNPTFTEGQGRRMRGAIIGYWATSFDLLRNNVESLYQPFAINDGSTNNNSGPIAYSKTYVPNNNFTGVNVWNCGPFTMRFQPGFEQNFYNLPNTLTVSPFTQFNHPTSTFIGVRIPVLSDTIVMNYFAPVCFSSYEPFVSGDIKSTYNFGSNIFTQELLDEIKASNPQLYEELQNQKYHIITKQTQSGYSDQKVIYKN